LAQASLLAPKIEQPPGSFIDPVASSTTTTSSDLPAPPRADAVDVARGVIVGMPSSRRKYIGTTACWVTLMTFLPLVVPLAPPQAGATLLEHQIFGLPSTLSMIDTDVAPRTAFRPPAIPL